MTEHRRREFGDFQTPVALAREICALLYQQGVRPKSIVEPTCGRGSFLAASLEQFSTIDKVIGVDINPEHVCHAVESVQSGRPNIAARVIHGDFFKIDWRGELADLPEPVLILGNPPWVTNATLGSMFSTNLPPKSNLHNHRGIDAITGKANFDIAEWMLLHEMSCLDGRHGTLAMLCKTSTARKVLAFCWKNDYRIKEAAIHPIDAQKHFGAAVDGCLLIATFSDEVGPPECFVGSALCDSQVPSWFGLREERLVAHLDSHDRWHHLFSPSFLRWRSGIKHDCTRVMELQQENGCFQNGLGEFVDVEDTCLYPMYKSTEISKGDLRAPTRWMIVPQRSVSEDTSALEEVAPRTWKYLADHANFLDRRASSIYRKRARFAVFGVGDYTFCEWKVAVSALHKQPLFSAIGMYRNKPIVFDDTCYLLQCDSRTQAESIAEALNSPIVREALSSYVFWDSKRPITTEVLNQLNLMAIAREL